ncbi:MAG: preprotein translocase subunit SecG [Bacteroidota bacterium]
MYTFLVLIELIVSTLLIGIILIQSSKGTGLSGSLGGSAMGTVFGVRRTSDLLTKATSGLAIAFLFMCLFINIFFLGGSSGKTESIIQRGTPTSIPAPSVPRSTPAAQPQQKGK